MKKLGLLLSFLFLWLAACDREGPVDPAISPVSGSVCKGSDLKAAADHSSSQDCIQYSWVTGDTLAIRHVNAGFNCCPEGFNAELKVEGDTLVITETENASLCDCCCLFDLNYHLTGISKRTWWIRVREPYVQQADQEKILFRAELKKTAEGEYCVNRTGYPWRL